MNRGEDDLELYASVAAGLKQAHAKVRALGLPAEESVALARRLLVITAAAKHDLADAARRLDRLMSELEDVPRGDGGGRARAGEAPEGPASP